MIDKPIFSEGMIENGSEDVRLEVCEDNKRDRSTLEALIEKHVEKGTEIHTDMWKGYNRLASLGYDHKVVNHSDPDNPFVGNLVEFIVDN